MNALEEVYRLAVTMKYRSENVEDQASIGILRSNAIDRLVDEIRQGGPMAVSDWELARKQIEDWETEDQEDDDSSTSDLLA